MITIYTFKSGRVFYNLPTLFCFMESSILFSESDAHAQLDDVEVIDRDQQFVDEPDDHDAERDDTGQDDGGAEEVHTICGHKETQERCAPLTIQASASDFSYKLDEPSQPRLQKFLINSKFPSKKTRSFNASWYNHFDWLGADAPSLHVTTTRAVQNYSIYYIIMIKMHVNKVVKTKNNTKEKCINKGYRYDETIKIIHRKTYD